jgi:hypothetical protein
MTTFKKKDFKRMVIESNNINEFVNDDGSMISGDEKYNKGVDIKTGPINMPGDEKGIPVDTDKHAANAIQPRNWWWSLSYGYGQGKGKSPIGSNIGNGPDGDTFSESIDESELTSEQRMNKMVEDILSRQSDNKDLVKRGSTSDVNRNGIPDIKDLSDTKMIIVGKLRDVLDTIESSNLSGEEVGIVLNHLLSNIDSSQIPIDYKNIIRKQL